MTTPLSSPTLRTEPDPNRLSCWCRGWGYFLNSAKEPPEVTLCGNCQAANEIERLSSPPNVERVARAFLAKAKEFHPDEPFDFDEMKEPFRSQLLECFRVALSSTQDTASQPIDMLLYCPRCGLQHVDAPAEPELGEEGRNIEWTNPPHKSHLCHGCGCIWRPADVPTNGVAGTMTVGKADNWNSSELAHPSTDTGDIRAATIEALTPSAETKAAYMGEFYIGLVRTDENGDEYSERVQVPWTTIKEIMAAIKARALNQPGSER